MAKPVLRIGSNGSSVIELQDLLNKRVPKAQLPFQRLLVVDGVFGQNTSTAVRTFQQLNHLVVDGIVGNNTWGALESTPDVGAPKRPKKGPNGHSITFRRTGQLGTGGAVMGELTVGGTTWATVERGNGYTFVRKGTYVTTMDYKNTGRRIKCLRFDEDPSIASHLIHDAYNDNPTNLSGCIAPGTLSSDGMGITGSAAAMTEVLAALGGFVDGNKITVTIENNVVGDETKDEWIRRRQQR